MKYPIILIALMVFSAADARDKFYKWTDAEGNIHYTQKKPKDVQTSEVKIHDSVSSGIQKSEDDEETDEELTPEQKQIEAYNKTLQAKTKSIQDKANCKIAKNNLLELQKTIRVSKKDPKTGEHIRLGDNERMQMMATAKRQIKDLCK